MTSGASLGENSSPTCELTEWFQRDIIPLRASKLLPGNAIDAATRTLPEAFRAAAYYAAVEGLRYKKIATIANTAPRDSDVPTPPADDSCAHLLVEFSDHQPENRRGA